MSRLTFVEDTYGRRLILENEIASDRTHFATRKDMGDVLHRAQFLHKLNAVLERPVAKPLELLVREEESCVAYTALVHFLPSGCLCLGCHGFTPAEAAKLIQWALAEPKRKPAETKVQFKRIAA